jgi:hypothetical protein
VVPFVLPFLLRSCVKGKSCLYATLLQLRRTQVFLGRNPESSDDLLKRVRGENNWSRCFRQPTSTDPSCAPASIALPTHESTGLFKNPHIPSGNWIGYAMGLRSKIK